MPAGSVGVVFVWTTFYQQIKKGNPRRRIVVLRPLASRQKQNPQDFSPLLSS
jgi:hypothetical protein